MNYEEEQVMLRSPKLYVALFVVALLVTAAITGPVFALQGDMKGKISSVDGERLQFVLKANNGEDVKFNMDEDAQVLINNKEAQLSDLKAGDQVTVVGRRDEDRWLAIEVRCNRK
jgi:hypothetical protein